MCCMATAANKPVLFGIQRRRNDFEAQLHTERSPAHRNFEFHSSSTQCSVFKSEIYEGLADLVPSLPLASCTAEAGHITHTFCLGSRVATCATPRSPHQPLGCPQVSSPNGGPKTSWTWTPGLPVAIHCHGRVPTINLLLLIAFFSYVS